MTESDSKMKDWNIVQEHSRSKRRLCDFPVCNSAVRGFQTARKGLPTGGAVAAHGCGFWDDWCTARAFSGKEMTNLENTNQKTVRNCRVALQGIENRWENRD